MEERGTNSGGATAVDEDDHQPIHEAVSEAFGLLRMEERLWLVLVEEALVASELDLLGDLVGDLPDREGCDSILTIFHESTSIIWFRQREEK